MTLGCFRVQYGQTLTQNPERAEYQTGSTPVGAEYHSDTPPWVSPIVIKIEPFQGFGLEFARIEQ